ncbi:replication protein A 14 kDa subunit [Erpetoichthys calabaricus]|uniref:Replication protein A3 n=1 Tax=Erpetoichthys calabaricus TaxID=27687 RepID=A0A8C4SLK8_ERPCA|nr:replication protein A 14 kDa subunit [Erpetoichthys calabaricus]
MADTVFEIPRARINSSMLSQYINRSICFVGRVEKIHPSGLSFILSDGEGKNASIELSEPLEEELSGTVEVIGRVTTKATIFANTFTPFREDKISFDLPLYNEALKVIHDFPQFYPFETVESE